MSVFSWKRSGWLVAILPALLMSALIIILCSTGIRSNFKNLPLHVSFNREFYPEIGFFNLILFLAVMCGLACTALRYVYVADQNQITSKKVDILNKIALLPGSLSYLGLLLAAAFPPIAKQKDAIYHSIGAYAFFGMGVFFSVLQTVLTYLQMRCSPILLIRTSLVVLLAAAFIGSISVTALKTKSSSQGRNEIVNITTPAAKYAARVNELQAVNFGLETAFVFTYALFFFSFFLEFQKVSTYIIIRPLIHSETRAMSTSTWTVTERV